MKLLLLFVCCALAVIAEKKEKKVDLSHGFRTEIDWVTFDKAIGIAKDLNKPIFLLIHKTWCGACKGLKREFNSNPKVGDLIDLSKKFVMINVEDDDEPEDSKYAPDGGYIPRILFLDTDGEPLTVNNEQRYKNNKYFYPLVPQIVEAMEKALKEFAEPSTKEDKDNESESAAETSEDGAEEENEVEEEQEDKKEEEKDEKEEKENTDSKKEDKDEL